MKKLIVIALFALMLIGMLAFAACNNDKKDDTDTTEVVDTLNAQEEAPVDTTVKVEDTKTVTP